MLGKVRKTLHDYFMVTEKSKKLVHPRQISYVESHTVFSKTLHSWDAVFQENNMPVCLFVAGCGNGKPHVPYALLTADDKSKTTVDIESQFKKMQLFLASTVRSLHVTTISRILYL